MSLLENDGGDWKPGDPWPRQQTPEPPGRFRQDMHTRWRCENRLVLALGCVWAAFLVLAVGYGWLVTKAPVARSTPVQMEMWQ